MKIECPHCQEDNTIEFADNISCTKCEKSFKGFKFSKRKLVSATAALTVGVLGGYQVNDRFETARYPVEIEYAVLDLCLNSSGNLVNVSWHETKKDVCLCALKETVSDMPYSEYKANESLFITTFRRNANAC